uniref:Uncharacterized protein n=1 Tax=Acrobeloides nanus TaxID=290746 RepID=A0A914DVY7_9BILA
MDPKAIQQNRDPIGYTKRTRRYPPIKNVSTSSNSSLLSPGNPHSVETHSPQESVMEVKTEQMLEDFLFHRLCAVEVHVEKLR